MAPPEIFIREKVAHNEFWRESEKCFGEYWRVYFRPSIICSEVCRRVYGNRNVRTEFITKPSENDIMKAQHRIL